MLYYIYYNINIHTYIITYIYIIMYINYTLKKNKFYNPFIFKYKIFYKSF